MLLASLASGIQIKRKIASNLIRGRRQKPCLFRIQWILNFLPSFSSFMINDQLQAIFLSFYLLNAQIFKTSQKSCTSECMTPSIHRIYKLYRYYLDQNEQQAQPRLEATKKYSIYQNHNKTQNQEKQDPYRPHIFMINSLIISNIHCYHFIPQMLKYLKPTEILHLSVLNDLSAIFPILNNIYQQQMLRAHHSIIPRLLIIARFNFAVGKADKRSYYDILDLNQNFTPKQLRKNFLTKARKFHPDHNQSPEAAEQFKILKEAYETLKDAQKKHMYDSGVGETSDEVAPVHNQQVKMGRKYYENKWYGYQKPKTEDTRDEYYKVKSEFFHQKPVNPLKYVATFTIFTLAIFGYDFLSTLETDKSRRVKQAKTVIDNSVASERETKKQILMQRYMEKRAQVNKVDL